MKIRLMAACLLAALLLGSCRGGEKAEQDSGNEVWEKLSPEELDFNPFRTIGKDWMALAVGKDEGMNSMTISWGGAGVLWNKPVFTVYVSSDRYSKRLMDDNAYFTVMAFPHERRYKDALLYIGSKSKRDEPDKTADAGFTVEYTELGNPLFREAALAFECRIIYREEFKMELLPSDVRRMYEDTGLHTMYVGEIVNVYGKRPAAEQ